MKTPSARAESVTFDMLKWISIFLLAICSPHLLADSFSKHFPTSVKNLDRSNPPMIVLITGLPGMGRELLAKKLEGDLLGVRLSSDDISQKLREEGRDPEANFVAPIKLVHKRLSDMVEAIKKSGSPNHFFIFDGSFGSATPIIKYEAKIRRYAVFTIRMEAPREEVELVSKEMGLTPKEVETAYDEYELVKLALHDFTFDASRGNFEESYRELVEELTVHLQTRDSLFISD